MKLPTSDAPAQFTRLLEEVEQVVLSLFRSGLTAASAATRDRLQSAWKESTQLRLLRLGSTLRVANEEVRRFLANDEAFSVRRLSFFLGRARLLARATRRAIVAGDDEGLTLLLATPPATPCAALDLAIMGVASKLVPGVFCAFEFYARRLDDGSDVNWSCVFPMPARVTEVGPGAFLSLTQAQGFRPRELLSAEKVRVQDVQVTTGLVPRLQLGKTSSVELGGAVDWSAMSAWEPGPTRQRLAALEPSPLDLPTDGREPIVLRDWCCGGRVDLGLRDRLCWSVSAPGLQAVLAVSAGSEGQERSGFLDDLDDRPQAPLFALLHYERGLVVLEPLTLLDEQGPRYLTHTEDPSGARALLRALRS